MVKMIVVEECLVDGLLGRSPLSSRMRGRRLCPLGWDFVEVHFRGFLSSHGRGWNDSVGNLNSFEIFAVDVGFFCGFFC